MGNTLVKNSDPNSTNRNIKDSILGNRVKEILREQYIPTKDDNGKDVPLKINQMIACCTGNASAGEVKENQFITIKLPTALNDDNKFCREKGRCIEASNLGLQFPNTKCDKNWIPGREGICDKFMVDKCAKELYDAGCLKIKVNKNGKKVRVWDASNKNCFDKRGRLIYGNEECVCLNSATGFNLNMDPSTKISDNIHNKDQNPYGLEGPSSGVYSGDNNTFTKYSLDIFGYEPQYQYPNVFDDRCAGRQKSVAAGISNAYKLSNYKTKPTICLNQINIKDSDIGQANMSNIKQNNDCGGSGSKKPLKVEENPKEREARINKEKEIQRREAERLEKEKKEKLEAERLIKEEARIEAEKEAEKKRQEMIKAIQKQAEDKKRIKDLERQKQLIEEEKALFEEEQAEKELEKERLQAKLIEAEQKHKEVQEEKIKEKSQIKQQLEEAEERIVAMETEAETQNKLQEEEDIKEEKKDKVQNMTIIIGGSLLFFIIVILVIILLMRGSGKTVEN